MNYEVRLTNGIGKANFGNGKSAGKKKKEITQQKKVSLQEISSKIKSTMNTNAPQAISATGKMVGVGAAAAAVALGVSLASKGADLYITYKSALTGDDVYYGNIKASKDMYMSLGGNYIKGAIRNHFIDKNIVQRQNNSLMYGQTLYNLNNYGEKHRVR